MSETTEAIVTGDLNAHSVDFKDAVTAALETDPALATNSEGNLERRLQINNRYLTYTAFGPEPQGPGKSILWIKYSPTHALELEFDPASDFLFGVSEDLSQPIRRRYRYGGMIGASGGLPDLFTAEHALTGEEAQALLDFMSTPHLKLGNMALFATLTEEEKEAKTADAQKVAKQRRNLQRDLDALARTHYRL